MMLTGLMLLSFDDRVSKYTPEIVEIVHEYQMNANFYIKGSNVMGNEDAILKMKEYGFGVCNHTWSHPDITDLNSLEIFNELWSTSMYLFMVTGEMPDCFRPPYGKVNQDVIDVATRLGMRIDWSLEEGVFDSLDWKYPIEK